MKFKRLEIDLDLLNWYDIHKILPYLEKEELFFVFGKCDMGIRHRTKESEGYWLVEIKDGKAIFKKDVEVMEPILAKLNAPKYTNSEFHQAKSEAYLEGLSAGIKLMEKAIKEQRDKEPREGSD